MMHANQEVLVGSPTRGPRILQTVFVHFTKVEVVCPLCGHTETRVFYRDKPMGSFYPVHRCPCGRYEYSLSVH